MGSPTPQDSTEEFIQGIIEELPDDERDKVPFEDFELSNRGAAEPEEDEPKPAKIGPAADWTDDQIAAHLLSEGRDSVYIASYLAGWHKKPFKSG